ncbi:MAG: Clp protease N-terminal domain-containing protein [Candidatus Omnitrophota bacterium]
MRLDRFTLKLQEALQDAVSLATENGQQQVEPEHLFYTLLKQEGSIAAEALEKSGISSRSLLKLLEEDFRKAAKVSGKNLQTYFSGRFHTLLQHAAKEAKALKDEFVSGEHILLALFSDEDSAVTKEFKKLGVTKEKILSALAEVRGSHRITDENPEEKFKALEKYGQDITEIV